MKEEEAINYLKRWNTNDDPTNKVYKVHQINHEQAKQIYKAVGGRPIRLQAAAMDYLLNGNLEGMCIVL